MWWQALPPLGIIAGFAAVMFAGPGISHMIFEGKPSRRGLTQCTHIGPTQKQVWLRESFMTGNTYESRGLEYIPDD